jgi:hypothetical protein
MSLRKLCRGIGLLTFLAPFAKADGNCNSRLEPLAGADLGFAWIYHDSDGTSFSSGTVRLDETSTVPWYWSDRTAQPAGRLELSIDSESSQAKLGTRTFDLNCDSKDTLMRGTTADPKVSLTLSLFPKSGKISSGYSVDSADDGRVRAVGFPTSRTRPISDTELDDLAAKAEAALISLTTVEWVQTHLPKLASDDPTHKLERIVQVLSDLAAKTTLVGK